MSQKEYHHLELEYAGKVKDAEAKARQLGYQLQAYENIEKELDDIILQAANGKTK